MAPMSQPPEDSDSSRSSGGPEQPTQPVGDPSQPPGYGTAGYGTAGYGTAGYGSTGYGAGGHPPQGYGGPAYGAPGQPPMVPYQAIVPPPTHGRGLASMIVGIVSLVMCFGYGIGLLGSPVAWWLGAKSLKEIDAAPGQYSGRGMAQAGQILGIIGTVLLGLFLLALVAILVIFVVVEANSGPSLPAESF
jgi:hypothetical protein